MGGPAANLLKLDPLNAPYRFEIPAIPKLSPTPRHQPIGKKGVDPCDLVRSCRVMDNQVDAWSSGGRCVSSGFDTSSQHARMVVET